MKYLEMLEEVEDKGSVELNLEQFYDILDVYKKEVVFKSLDKVSSIEGDDIEIDTPNTIENTIIDMGFLVYDATEMYKFAESNKFTNVYYTVFGFGKYLNPATDAHHAIIDTLPFDFDSKNLQTSFTDARTLVSWCHKHDVIPRVTFSGNKGFHVFIDIIPIIINNVGNQQKLPPYLTEDNENKTEK